MPKKLKLSDLKIQSFVTSLENGEKKKVKGGGTILLTNCAEDTCLECETTPSCVCDTYFSCISDCGTCTCEDTVCGITICKTYLVC